MYSVEFIGGSVDGRIMITYELLEQYPVPVPLPNYVNDDTPIPSATRGVADIYILEVDKKNKKFPKTKRGHYRYVFKSQKRI